jgi:hypothetical protein
VWHEEIIASLRCTGKITEASGLIYVAALQTA